MFSSIGKKIQSYSKVIFAVEVIFSFFAGIGFGSLVANFFERRDDGMIIAFYAAIIFIGLGIFLAWVGQMRLYAYGKIAESCEVMMVLMKRMEETQKGGEAPAPAPVPAPAPAPAPVRKCSCGTVLDDDAIFCPVCGKRVADEKKGV